VIAQLVQTRFVLDSVAAGQDFSTEADHLLSGGQPAKIGNYR